MSTPAEIVIADVPCVGCGYNLRTLPAGTNCVECGTAINQSLETTLLRCGSETLAAVARATSLAGTLNVLAMIVTLLTAGILALMAVTRTQMRPVGFLILTFVGYICIAVLHAKAAFGYTRLSGIPALFRRAKVIRGSSILFVCATLIPVCVMFLAAANANITPVRILVVVGLWVVLLPSLPVFTFLTGRHFAEVCRLGGLHSLVTWQTWLATILAMGVGLIELGFVMFFLILSLYPDQRPPGLLTTFFTLSILGGLAIAGAGFIGATILLFRTARKIRTLAPPTSGTLTGLPTASEGDSHVTMLS